MPDRATELAAWLASDGHRLDAITLTATIKAHWPGLTVDELHRGFAIAAETKRQDGAEDLDEADALDALHEAAARPPATE